MAGPSPPGAATADIASFAGRLLVYCRTLGGSVTSWGRTEKHNAAVGGVPTSLHLQWIAADVVYDALPALEVAEAAAARLDLQVLREADHDHISPAGGPH